MSDGYACGALLLGAGHLCLGCLGARGSVGVVGYDFALSGGEGDGAAIDIVSTYFAAGGRHEQRYLPAGFGAEVYCDAVAVDAEHVAFAVGRFEFEAVGRVDTQIAVAREVSAGESAEGHGDFYGVGGGVGESPQGCIGGACHLGFEVDSALAVVYSLLCEVYV